MSKELRSVALLVLLLISYLAVTGAVREQSEAALAQPDNQPDPAVLWTEDFETGQGSHMTRVADYQGPDGVTYTVDQPFDNTSDAGPVCLGLLGSLQWPDLDPDPSTSGCVGGTFPWGSHRGMADYLADFAGQDVELNHAATYAGNDSGGSSGVGKTLMESSPTIPLDGANRWVRLAFDIVGRADNANTGRCNPQPVTVGVAMVFQDADGGNHDAGSLAPADPCASPAYSYTSVFGRYEVKHYQTRMLAATDAYTSWGYHLTFEENYQNQGDDNAKFGIDNVSLLDISPQLDQFIYPTTVKAGDTTTLTYTITNTSDLLAKPSWSFTNTLPSPLVVATPSNTTSTCGTMPTVSGNTITAQGNLSQGETSCRISIDVTSVVAGTHTNRVGDFADLEYLKAPADAPVTFTAPDVSITKAAVDPDTGDPVTSYIAGTDLDFTLAVRNDGPDTAHTLRVSDTFPDGITPSGTTEPTGWTCDIDGQELTCTKPSLPVTTTETITVHTSVASSVTGSQKNTAHVSAEFVSDPDHTTSTVTLAAEPVADLSITKAHRRTPTAGEDLTYDFAVTNHGPSDVASFRIDDTLDPGVTVKPPPSDISCDPPRGQELICTGGPITAGSTGTFSITVTVDLYFDTTQQVLNTATVSPPPPTTDPNPDNDTATDATGVDPSTRADLGLTKQAQGSLTAGEPVTYRLTVTNHRGPAVARDVTIHDELPPYLHYRSSRGAGWACQAEGRRVTCRHSNPLGIDQSATVDLTVLVDQAAPGRAVNHATATSAAAGAPAHASASNRVRAEADLETILSHQQRQYHSGDTIAFTYTVINHGPSAARDVVLTHSLPAGITFPTTTGQAMATAARLPELVLVSRTTTAREWPLDCATDGGQRLVCRTDTLLVGRFQLQVEAQIGDQFTGTFNSALDITSPTPDPDPDNNRSSDLVPDVLPAAGRGRLPSTGPGLVLLLAIAGSALLAATVFLALSRTRRQAVSTSDTGRR